MNTKLLMGNEAIALGAIAAGVQIVTGYPGTPSTEVLETIAKSHIEDIYIEWSVNEKVALEVGVGAAYSGARTLVTMKQVGLNVASDPLMCLSYIGIKGGMVILVADDPGPISSQTEQDTRHFAKYANLPIFDPPNPEAAYTMIGDAFEFSEKHHTPVIFRPTTRICHACAAIAPNRVREAKPISGFVRDSKWVIFPKLSYENHKRIELLQQTMSEDFATYHFNTVTSTLNEYSTRNGIICSGVSTSYTKEALSTLKGEAKLLTLTTPYPFPETLILDFIKDLNEVLIVEELDPVIEESLITLCGKHNINLKIYGKYTKNLPFAGEYSYEILLSALSKFLNIPFEQSASPTLPTLPVRPPFLCAGCPHRASFYAVKKAMRGKDALFTGDIGCYTLGNAKPLDMVDTCLCMGAGVTMAQGLKRTNQNHHLFAFIGDSTFFHSGITGIINAVYNQTPMTLVVLDNHTTAMTGHQPHPGTGCTMMGEVSSVIDIATLLKGCGVQKIYEQNPLELEKAVAVVQEASSFNGVSAIIFKSPCIAVTKPEKPVCITENCVNCKVCIKEIGCPALSLIDGKVTLEPSLCTGCGLCTHVCPKHAIEKGGNNHEA